jgi:hypothetical protein
MSYRRLQELPGLCWVDLKQKCERRFVALVALENPDQVRTRIMPRAPRIAFAILDGAVARCHRSSEERLGVPRYQPQRLRAMEGHTLKRPKRRPRCPFGAHLPDCCHLLCDLGLSRLALVLFKEQFVGTFKIFVILATGILVGNIWQWGW